MTLKFEWAYTRPSMADPKPSELFFFHHDKSPLNLLAVSRVLNSNFLVSGDLELLGTESNNERIPPQIESTILRQPEG